MVKCSTFTWNGILKSLQSCNLIGPRREKTGLAREISPVASLRMILDKNRTTKALIRLCECAGWSTPLLFANPRRQVFSRHGPIY